MKLRILFGLALICLVSSVAFAQSIYVDYDHSLDFSQYHTYAWGQQPNPNQIKNPFLAQEAQTQINAQLQSKGLQLVTESQNPDLIVLTSGGMKTQVYYNAWSTGGWRWGGGMGTITQNKVLLVPSSSTFMTQRLNKWPGAGRVKEL